MKKIIYLIVLFQLLLSSAWAREVFLVKDIEIQGLQRISPATVETYLPIKRGEVLEPSKTAAILRALYQTGFFDHISLSKENHTLIIHVEERPTIGQLKISGNSVVPTDKLTAVMKTLDIAEGRAYNPVILERIKQSLLNQYYQLGRYNARVDIKITPMSRNRVLVNIIISEGLVAKVRHISIIGNKAYDEKTLIKQFELTTPGVFTFFTQTDRYSDEKFESSITKLRDFYLDNGYLRFQIKSSQSQVTPDRKSIYITIVISEGEPYSIDSYRLSGDLILPRQTIEKHIQLKSGERFSRQKIVNIQKAISKEYGDKGYLYASVGIQPQINDQNRTVSIIFDVKPGKLTYVRHITFSDNSQTNDLALRRELIQMEAAPASSKRLDDSKQRLSLLPFIQNVDMTVKPAAEADDQVDVDYKVKEGDSAQATFKVGYSQLYHLILGAGFSQKNFFGTGNTFGLNFSHSKYENFFSMDYTNPYYTDEGVSRSFNLSVSRIDPTSVGLNSGYTANDINLGVLYGIPVGQESGVINRVLVGINYQNTHINLSDNPENVSNQVRKFVDDHGTNFNELNLKLGYSRDSRDRAIFPTRGIFQTVFANAYVPVAKRSVGFYTLDYHGKLYQPLTEKFIFTTRADLGYGNGFGGIDNFPFFKNYYAGGISTVRGFQDYTLGARDSRGKPYGGNILADASIGLIFPNYISENLRTSIYADAGNVWSSLDMNKFGGESANSGPVRYSVGIQAEWLIPMLGPVTLSLAKPFLRKHDKNGPFQFDLGFNF